MMDISNIYCEPLTDETSAIVKLRLMRYRRSLLGNLLKKLQGSLASGANGAQNNVQTPVVSQLHSLFFSLKPEEFKRVGEHWSIGFYLSRLIQNWDNYSGQTKQLLSNLSTEFLLDWFNTDSKESEVRFDTYSDDEGKIYSASHSCAVRLLDDHFRNVTISWYCLKNKVTVSSNTDHSFQFNTQEALRFQSSLEVTPFPHLANWNVPLLEKWFIKALPDMYSEPASEDQQPSPPPGVLPLTETIEDSFRILSDLWPEILDWAVLLVPAFAQLPAGASEDIHRSATHGPGLPIFLTPVSDSFLHAEDIVHELQHQRLKLLMGSNILQEWDNRNCTFVSLYRSDPRPLQGIHLGLHAFLAVNELRIRAMDRGMLDHEQQYRLFKTHRMNLFAFRTLLEHEVFVAEAQNYLVELARKLTKQHDRIESIGTIELGSHVNTVIEQHITGVAHRSDEVRNADPKYQQWEETISLARSL